MVHDHAGKYRNSLATYNFIQFQFSLTLPEINFSQPSKILICISEGITLYGTFLKWIIWCVGWGKVGY